MTSLPGSTPVTVSPAGGETTGALQQHCPDRWSGYVACRSDLPSATCEYCATEFIPFTRKQRFCDRKCGDSARVDNSYFGGKRRSTIGLADGVCQLCERQVDRGLSSHHVFGKENGCWSPCAGDATTSSARSPRECSSTTRRPGSR